MRQTHSRRNFAIRFMFAAILAILAAPVRAETADAPEAHFKFDHYYTDEKVNPDGTSELTTDFALVILKEDVVAYAKQKTIVTSASAEKADVISAYTLKPDGRRIEVPKDNYQLDVNTGKDSGNPAYSDLTALTVIFPDVAVGDTVAIKYKVTQIKPTFPNQYSSAAFFPKSFLYGDVRARIDLPVAMHAKLENYGLTQKSNKEENGRQLVEFSFNNNVIQKTKENEMTVFEFDSQPGYAVSTFPSYGAIAEAYGQGARPKAVASDQVKKLAADIVKDKTDKREKVRALYEWVSKNITFAGNCIGVGSVVPRDLDFVIKNKMGDCKDHATLMQALLSAEGVDSTQALINATRIYHLPKVPLTEAVNHVINYVPSLNLFIDATSSMPFGMLPRPEIGKPVLLVDGYKEGLTTPMWAAADNVEKSSMKIKIGEDGSAHGTLDIAYKGAIAADTYEFFKDLHGEAKKDFLDKLVKRSNFEGTAELKGGTFDDNNFTYSYGYNFDLKNFLQIGSPGAISIYPVLSMPTMALAIGFSRDDTNFENETVCSSDNIIEDYVYEFPKNVKILAVPDNFSTKSDLQTYASTYHQDGQTLTVKREFHDVTPGPVCKPSVSKSYKEVADKVWPDIKAQIVYK